MSRPVLPDGLTHDEEAVVLLMEAHPDWSHMEVWRALKPASLANNSTAKKNIEDILARPRVKARLQALQAALVKAREQDIVKIDDRQFNIATAEITDVLTVAQGGVTVLDSQDWPVRARAAVKAVTVIPGRDGNQIRVEMHGPTASAELVYKRRGLLTPEASAEKNLTVNFTKQEVLVIGLVGDPEARRALDLIAARLEGESRSNGG